MKKLLYGLGLSFLLLWSFSQEAMALEEKTHLAVAYKDKEKTQPLYTEKHKAYYKNSYLVKSTNDYFDMSGKKIAELNSDYSKNFHMPTYVFKDLRTGAEEGLRLSNNQYYIYRKKPGKQEEQTLLENPKDLFSCQGWHYYLLSNLAKVEREIIKLKLILPSRLDFYGFRARLIKADGNLLHLRIELDSWLLRIFADHLSITYDKESKKLVYYSGISNILDEKGETQDVHIFYENFSKLEKS